MEIIGDLDKSDFCVVVETKLRMRGVKHKSKMNKRTQYCGHPLNK